MLLFAAVLVVDQDPADLSADAVADRVASEVAENEDLFDLNDQARLAAIRHIADSVLPLAEGIELANDVSAYPVNDKFTTGAGRLE